MALAERAGVKPDPWQIDVLRSTSQMLLLNASRQTGKSTVAALLALWTMISQPGCLVLILSPSEDQSRELFKRVNTFYQAIDAPVPIVSETTLTLELATGSRLVARPGNERTVRGLSAVALLIIDEAALVPDEMYFALTPMLAVSNGRTVALSTPHGQRGWYWQAWSTPAEDDADVERFVGRADDCPRITKHFLARELHRIGPWWFNQEYNMIFHESETSAFRANDVDRAFSADVTFDSELFA